MKKDRFLMALLVGILVLVIAAIIVFFTRADQLVYVSGTEPADVVHNYVVAVQLQDLEIAYGYLADLKGKPAYANFALAFTEYAMESNVGVELGSTKIVGDNATVEMIIMQNTSRPLSSGYTTASIAGLVKQKGEWKISAMPYNFWNWDWYQK